jgi:hypothetical protein
LAAAWAVNGWWWTDRINMYSKAAPAATLMIHRFWFHGGALGIQYQPVPEGFTPGQRIVRGKSSLSGTPTWSWPRPKVRFSWGQPSPSYIDAVLPLWTLVLLIAAPTGVLWWRDRRHPEGDCPSCGYDLAGIATGVCPECGKAA